jgi:hypothetical protein
MPQQPRIALDQAHRIAAPRRMTVFFLPICEVAKAFCDSLGMRVCVDQYPRLQQKFDVQQHALSLFQIEAFRCRLEAFL